MSILTFSNRILARWSGCNFPWLEGLSASSATSATKTRQLWVVQGVYLFFHVIQNSMCAGGISCNDGTIINEWSVYAKKNNRWKQKHAGLRYGLWRVFASTAHVGEI